MKKICQLKHAKGYTLILHFESEFQEQNVAIFPISYFRIYLSFNFNIIIISSMAIPSVDHFFPYKVSMCNSSWLFTIWGGKIWAPLWNDFAWPDLAPIFWNLRGGNQITIMNWLWLAAIFRIFMRGWNECKDLYFNNKEDFYWSLFSWLSVSRFCPDLLWFRRVSWFLFQLTKDSALWLDQSLSDSSGISSFCFFYDSCNFWDLWRFFLASLLDASSFFSNSF